MSKEKTRQANRTYGRGRAYAGAAAWKLWNIAAIHSDGCTWSTQIQGVNLTSLDAQATLVRHIAERLQSGPEDGRVVLALIANAEGYSTRYTVDPATGALEVADV